MTHYLSGWWTFASCSVFRSWYSVTDRDAEARFRARCTQGITREYLFHEFVCSDDAERAIGIAGDLERFRRHLAS
jgi:hypothetical protein